jgi:hypothetical protein
VFGSEKAEAREGAKKKREKNEKREAPGVVEWKRGNLIRARGRSTTHYHLHSTLLPTATTNDRRVRASARLHGRVTARQEGSTAGNPAMLAFRYEVTVECLGREVAQRQTT